MSSDPNAQTAHCSSVTTDEVLVRVEGVSKKFCRSLKKSLWYGVCDIAGELSPFGRRPRIAEVAGNGSAADEGNPPATSHPPLATSPPATSHSPLVTPKAPLRDGEFWAVNDVSFELRRGECLGLIGHNGAGKTTLLKMLNGLIKPDSGRIEMRGRVGALIALGAGFNPILTGRENIYVNAAVLGLSKSEIEAKLEEIIEFAEIGDFIDAPVQTYSSGMGVRLGFSIASSLTPDVLILDEVLAVGDIGFTIKCLNRVRELASRAAVIFVSHNMQFISSFCTRVILMNHGRLQLDAAESKGAIDLYFKMIKSVVSSSGTGAGVIKKALLSPGESITQGEPFHLYLEIEVAHPCEWASLCIYIMDESMSPIVCMPVNDSTGGLKSFPQGQHNVTLSLGAVDLVAGKYSFTAILLDIATHRSIARSQGLSEFRVYAEKANWGKIIRPILCK